MGAIQSSIKRRVKYFLTLVDDYSRTTWVHIMKNKDEAQQALEKFINLDKTQFGKT